MGRTLIVTRHSGAVAWLEQKGFRGEVITHLSPEQVSKGDTIVGVLPVHIVAELKEKGAQVFIIVLPQVPSEMRGHELSPEQMDEFGARLLEVEVLKLREV